MAIVNQKTRMSPTWFFLVVLANIQTSVWKIRLTCSLTERRENCTNLVYTVDIHEL